MKNFNLIIIISIIAAFNLFGEELPLIDYNWSEITIPNNDRIDYNIITSKNELFLICENGIYYSSDYGKSLNKISKNNFNFRFFVYGYNYDSKNGIYMIIDDPIHNWGNMNIVYIPNTRDTIIEINQGGSPSIFKKYYDDIEYYSGYSYLVNDKYLLIGTDREVYLYDVQERKYERVKYFDDIIKDMKIKDSLLNGYKLSFLWYDKNNNRIDAYLTISDSKLQISSYDMGKSWDTNTFNNDCLQYHLSGVQPLYTEFNQLNKWISGNKVIDNECNYISFKYPLTRWRGALYIEYSNNHFNHNYFVEIVDKGTKLLISNNYLESFFLSSSIPYKMESLNYIIPRIFTDGVISLIVSYKDPPEYTLKMYIGSPATSVDDFQDENNGLYPNPATDYITINPGNNGLKHFAETDEQVEIYNSFGELVMQDVKHLGDVGHLIKIDVSHLPVGLYFVKIGNKVEKFVKM